MPHSVKCFLEVNKDIIEILLVLHVLFTKDSRVSFSKAGLHFSDDVLRLWHKLVKDDIQHDFASTADEADCPVVLTQRMYGVLNRDV